MRRLRLPGSFFTIAVFCFALTALPASSAVTGTVTAQVTIASPCITVSPSTPIAFGSASFSQPSNFTVLTGAPAIGITNCGSMNEALSARATDANAIATGGLTQAATWDLVPAFSNCGGCFNYENELGNTCSIGGVNKYFVVLWSAGTILALTEGDVLLLDAGNPTLPFRLGPGGSEGRQLRMVTPCAGSDGGGSTMSFQVTLTASA
jgi:hypothetical protein